MCGVYVHASFAWCHDPVRLLTSKRAAQSHNKPLCRRDRANLHTSKGGKRQIKWHSSSLHTGDNPHLQITKIRVGDIFFSPPSTKGSSGYFRPLAYTANLDVWKKGVRCCDRDPCLYGNSEKQRCARSSWNHLLCCTTWPDWENDSLKSLNCPPTKKRDANSTRKPSEL